MVDSADGGLSKQTDRLARSIVTVFTRHGCHLCHVAIELLEGMSDELDFIADGQLVLNYQGSRSGKDQFFSIKGGISYNLIKIYGEEKWKPGKKSKSSSIKDKQSSEKKPGLFSGLKFKRK